MRDLAGFWASEPGRDGPRRGWVARARRLLDDHQLDCMEQGYLLGMAAMQSIAEGDAASAYGTFGQAAKIADRFGDRDGMTLSRLGQGQALIRLGDLSRLGVARRGNGGGHGG